MKNIIWISLNHLKLLSKDKTAYLLLLALPLALTLITGMAFGESGSSKEAYILPLAIVDQDNSDVSEYLIQALTTENTRVQLIEEDSARELVKNKEIPAAVIITYGFQKDLQEGRPVEITVLQADLQESPRIVEQLVNNQLFRLKANTAAAEIGQIGQDFSPERWIYLFEQAADKWHPSPAVHVHMENISVSRDSDIPLGNQQSSPGYVVMFGMMTVIVSGSTTLLEERRNGTLTRLLSAPVNRFQLLTGKMLGFMVSGIFQMILMITAGQFIFGVNWGQNLPAVILLVAALSFASTGFGMMLASLCRTQSQAESLGVLSVIIMSMLGGAWWPVEILPSYMQILSRLVPSGWAMQGFIDLTLRGADLGHIAIPLLALTGFGTAFLTMGASAFRFQK
ncbi:ABC transporter permease [Candidatus Contubernalis alkaliaceticus]|uniref:ABC transporter permease n=1 Tax=Candidatus Contubernalis alkaliaceticus TaxID=338645 RepID=UPI001F4BEDC0|nr:ABC transporter permease [Candidatus Contubernalis alkalaceticus]UNC90729.1 ABC transporter permease [Candidatus Contubernalis alkalaceticus]